MPLQQLDNLVSIGKLKAEPAAQAELDGLMRSGAARIKHTLRLAPQKWRVLDLAHKKRNLVEYEGAADIDANLLEAMIRIAREVEASVLALGPLPR